MGLEKDKKEEKEKQKEKDKKVEKDEKYKKEEKVGLEKDKKEVCGGRPWLQVAAGLALAGSPRPCCCCCKASPPPSSSTFPMHSSLC